MILSDADIGHFRNLRQLDISPWRDELLQPASYDLTLAPYVTFIDEPNGPWVEKFDGHDLHYWLNPGDFALFSTVEKVTITPTLCAQVAGKSTWARKGLIVESAGWVDPGFTGQLTLELANIGPNPIILYAGMPICQIVFMELRTKARIPYGKERNHYQDQVGPTPARQ